MSHNTEPEWKEDDWKKNNWIDEKLYYLDLEEAEFEKNYEKRLQKKGIFYKSPDPKYLNIVIQFLLIWFIASQLYWHSEISPYLALSYQSGIAKGEYWRLLTALFVHADMKHLLSNTPLFIVFSWYLRSYFGYLAFPTIPLTVGILANYFTVSRYDPQTQLIGASGMVYGIVGMWMLLYLFFETRYSFLNKLMRVLGFSLVMMFPTTFYPQVSYLAHGVGFVLGLVFAIPIVLLNKHRKTD